MIVHMDLFLKVKRPIELLVRLLELLRILPYEKWKREHSIHHATSGNLDKRGTGDIWVMTVDEYVEASFWGTTLLTVSIEIQL